MNLFINHNSIYLHWWVIVFHPTGHAWLGLCPQLHSSPFPWRADSCRLYFQGCDSSECWPGLANGKHWQVGRGQEEGRSYCILLPPSLWAEPQQPIHGFGSYRAGLSDSASSDGPGPWGSVTLPHLHVLLAGGNNDSLLLLTPGWPQRPLLGFHHLYNQFSACNSFSFISWIACVLQDLLLSLMCSPTKGSVPTGW